MNVTTNHVVRVWAGGRERKLYRLKPGGPYQVRFQVRGKDIVRSTRTTNKKAAQHKAKEIVEIELQMRPTSCTWRELSARVSALEELVRRNGGAK